MYDLFDKEGDVDMDICRGVRKEVEMLCRCEEAEWGEVEEGEGRVEEGENLEGGLMVG